MRFDVPGKLKAALEWAARGFRVFPLVENGKEPISQVSPPRDATTDPTIIAAWWRDPVTGFEREHNIGCLTNDYIVADVDVKDGKPGLHTFEAYGGSWDSLVVETPTGGYHVYYHGPDSSMSFPGAGAGGLDIRSHNGYVVAPGSVINGVAYRVVRDAHMAWVPPTIEAHLRAPMTRAERDWSVELDTASGIANATAWLLHTAPLAVEGLGGDATTYEVACKLVNDYALTEETATELLLRHWNDRCSPPWMPDELFGKVENAYKYSTGNVGSALPERTFGDIAVPEQPPSPAETFLQSVRWGNIPDAASIGPRPWLYGRLLMRGEITALPGTGSAGKSLLALIVAAHGACGKDFGPYKLHGRAFRTVVYNAEDDAAEQGRRIAGICKTFALDPDTVRNSILAFSRDDLDLVIASAHGRVPEVNHDHVRLLRELASQPDVGLLILDPLVEVHLCDEQDNGHMRFVMATIKKIAREANVAALVPHHTAKAGGNNGVKAGNADSARGASSIINSARIAITLFGPTEQDCEVYGIRPEERNLFVRMDDAKMNLALASSQSVWFKKEGIKLAGGDEVGSFHFYDMSNNADIQRRYIAQVCLTEMSATGQGSMTMKSAVIALQNTDQLYARMTEAQVRLRIEQALHSKVTLDDGAVQCVRSSDGTGADRVRIEMT